MGLSDAWAVYSPLADEPDTEVGDRERLFVEALEMGLANQEAPDLSEAPGFEEWQQSDGEVGDDLSGAEVDMAEWMMENTEETDHGLFEFDDRLGDAADSIVPWWTKYAVAGLVLIAILAVLSPYADLAAGVAG